MGGQSGGERFAYPRWYRYAMATPEIERDKRHTGAGGREPLLSVRELMALYGWSERWWRYRIAEGLPRRRWGGQWRFRASEVEAWIESRRR